MSLKWNYREMKDVSFMNLITKRIYNILIIANPYDAFMLEDDGRIEEKMFNEYMELRLRYPPVFTQVSTTEEAARVLGEGKIDLAICMPGIADNDAFAVAREVKRLSPGIPCVVLTPFSHGITRRMQDEDLSIFDYVFCWLGNTNLILSIIKLVEDKMNLEHDTKEGGVQMILLVEDSIRYYSSILPHLYNYVLVQTIHFSEEGLNLQAATLRMRGRPKIALARTYAEAREMFDKYHDNILGVICDARFPIKESGEKDAEAGLKLMRYMRSAEEYMPLVMQSSETANRARAESEGFQFVDKNSKMLNIDLRHILEEHFGFGDFIFRDPATKRELVRIRTLKDLQDNILSVPRESLMYHVSRNHISRWLSARALFPLSEFLKRITWHKLRDVEKHRQIIYDAILYYRRIKNLGVVAVFDRRKFDRFAHFARIGDGSLGGKGRGLAFLDHIIKSNPAFSQLGNVSVQIPKTVVICTDVFDEFMERNGLYQLALSDAPDEEILGAFLRAQLPETLRDDLNIFIDATHAPLAIRSSSLLEDSHYQPFAGIYATYMIPYLADRGMMLSMLASAIKSVYASVYYKASKAYMNATSNVIDQEKMAAIVQQVAGKRYGNKYYPTFSGVLRSQNFYPVGDEKAEEGIASLALGLGKYIVDGGQSLRVSPYHPEKIMQLSEIRTALTQTQTRFFALDLDHVSTDFKVDDGFNILSLPVKEADRDGSLDFIASTYVAADGMIYDEAHREGRKIISFAGALKYGVIPLAEVMRRTLLLGVENMKRPVEIELAGNIGPGEGDSGVAGEVYLLQIRPIVDSKQQLDTDLDTIGDADCLARSSSSLGHGIIDGIRDVVYVKTPEDFTPKDNPAIPSEIEKINRELSSSGTPYLLAGPGRWGSSDPWLGIPVKWAQISASRVIIETEQPGRHIEPSQGTHFFQNITSLGVGYLTTGPGTGFFRQEALDALAPVGETPHLRHVRLDRPLEIMLDGTKQTAVVLMRGGDSGK